MEKFIQSITTKGEVADILYIHCNKGWSSFRELGEHISGYKIDNDTITVFYDVGFGPGKTATKKISDKDMGELLEIMDAAVMMGEFEKSDTAIRTIHGVACNYDYDYKGRSERNCSSLFTDDALNMRYAHLINRIIN